jgi:hypothetical protein
MRLYTPQIAPVVEIIFRPFGFCNSPYSSKDPNC